MSILYEYFAIAYCGDNLLAKVFRYLDFVYFNIFRKHRNPLTPIIISDLMTKQEEEKFRIALSKAMEEELGL